MGGLVMAGLLRLFFTACQFLNCVAISFLVEKKKNTKKQKQKKVLFNLFAQMQETCSI